MYKHLPEGLTFPSTAHHYAQIGSKFRYGGKRAKDNRPCASRVWRERI